jgi:carbonic anhydrase
VIGPAGAHAGRTRALTLVRNVANLVPPDNPDASAIKISLSSLMDFPWIAAAVEAGTLQLHGWWFDLDRGALWSLDPVTGCFTPLA